MFYTLSNLAMKFITAKISIIRIYESSDFFLFPIPKNIRPIARSMRQTKEIVGANIYNRAFDSNYKGGDGVELISGSHANVAGGTFSNNITK